jgi:diguanylate cyclase (GGDEF)-like protein/PAS domain S-box-containing protein
MDEEKEDKVGSSFHKALLDNLYDAVYAVDTDRRITYWNAGAERLTGYGAAEVVGKHCRDNILGHVDGDGKILCLTDCPLQQAMQDKESREAEAYLSHRDGHRVPVVVRCSPVLGEGGEVVGGVEVFRDNAPKLELQERVEELASLALLDPLTGIGNRRYLEAEMEHALGELRRFGWSFGLLFIDIDRFKEKNDTYGHQVGDRVLATVSRTIANSLRSFDFLGRWGGEEFAAVISHAGQEQLLKVAERCRSLVERTGIPLDGGEITVTVSIGATMARPDDDAASLLERADGMMYASKAAGRNRVTTDQPPL